MSIVSYLKSKYSIMSPPVRAGMWFTVSNILLRGISFITVPIFTRILSTEDYGVITLYQSWVSMLGIIVSLNVWTGGFNIKLTREYENRGKVVSASQGLGVTFCSFFLLVSIFFLDELSFLLGLSKVQTLFVVLQVLFSIPINIWMQFNRFEYSYTNVVFISVLMSIVNPLLGYFLVINMEEKALARIVSFVLIEIILGTLCFFTNQKRNGFYDKKVWNFLFRFNIVLIPHYISTQILNQSDRVMIARMCSNSDAGIYGVAYNFGMLMTLVTGGLESMITPYTFKSLKAGMMEELNRMTMVVLMLVSIGAVAVMCIIPDVFRLLLPNDYYKAIYVIPVIVTATYFQFLYPLFSNIELYYGEKRYIAMASCFGALANVGLNYIFIKLFGYIAAAYTTLVCYMLFCIFHYRYMKKVLQSNELENVYTIRSILCVSLLLILVMFFVLYLYDNSLFRYGVIFILLIIVFVFKKRIVFLVRKCYGR